MEIAERIAAGIDERAIEALHRLTRYDAALDVDQIAQAVADGSALILPLDGGFSVLNISGNALHVWVACAYTGHAPDIKSSVADIIELAKLLKLKRLTFGTQRKGWSRLAPHIGFSKAGDKYERVL